MASNILHPLYPGPALLIGGTGYVTSQITTITTGATTVTGFTRTGGIGDIQLVTFDVQGDDVRVLWEGSTPTSSSGHILPGGTAYTWSANQYNNAKFILSGSGTASVICASAFNGG